MRRLWSASNAGRQSHQLAFHVTNSTFPIPRIFDMFLRSALARSRPLLVRSSKSSSRRLLSVSTTLPSATLTHTESASVSSPSTSTSSPAEVPGHPPVDWKLYRSLFKNSPTSPVTVYESICELGYDGAFEAFLRSLPDQRHFALAKRIVGYEPKYELLQRAKRLKRPNETMYLGHMMELLQVETLVIGGKSFAGGSYMEWLDWADIKDPIKGQKVSSRDPTKGGMCSEAFGIDNAHTHPDP